MATTSVLDFNNVIKLASNTRARQLVPALTQLWSRGKPCAVCQARKKKAIEMALKQIGGLPAAQLQEIRSLVGSDTVELYLPGQPKPIVIKKEMKK